MRVLGRLRVDGGVGVVRIEDLIDAPVAAVWSALTEPDRLAQWYGVLDGELRLGGRYHARIFASGWEGNGHIVACEPRRRIEFTSAETDSVDEHGTVVELAAEGESTRVTVEHSGAPIEYLFAYGAGTQIHVEDLANHVTGAGPAAATRSREDTDARFDLLEPSYRQLALKLESSEGGPS